jgi:hypothetical protein
MELLLRVLTILNKSSVFTRESRQLSAHYNEFMFGFMALGVQIKSSTIIISFVIADRMQALVPTLTGIMPLHS